MYFPLIDILRFLAAFAVMSFHYFSGSFAGEDGLVALFVNNGSLGVPLFFVISGFVIFFSLKKPLSEYALGRFLRLYPMFWVICTLTYILTLLVPGVEPLSFWLYVKNLFIVNNGNESLMVDGSYWTLTIEILFYIYIAVYVYLFKLRRLEIFYIGWLLLSLLTFYFGLYDAFILKLLLVRFAPYFVFGGVLGLMIESWPSNTWSSKARHIFILLVSALTPIYISQVLLQSTKPLTNFFGGYIVKICYAENSYKCCQNSRRNYLPFVSLASKKWLHVD